MKIFLIIVTRIAGVSSKIIQFITWPKDTEKSSPFFVLFCSDSYPWSFPSIFVCSMFLIIVFYVIRITCPNHLFGLLNVFVFHFTPVGTKPYWHFLSFHFFCLKLFLNLSFCGTNFSILSFCCCSGLRSIWSDPLKINLKRITFLVHVFVSK